MDQGEANGKGGKGDSKGKGKSKANGKGRSSDSKGKELSQGSKGQDDANKPIVVDSDVVSTPQQTENTRESVDYFDAENVVPVFRGPHDISPYDF